MTTTNLLEIDPDKLFEKCSIEEIIEIDKKLQIEIDKKRTELRSMVSDRYRDIITASDTIKTMQSTASTIVGRIDDLFVQFDGLQSTSKSLEARDTTPEDNREENEIRSIAIQVRIATFIPEHIWTCLDECDYSSAAQFYLLAQHIFTGLFLDTKYNISETMPIVQRLQININKFRDKILQGINKHLQNVDLNAEEASSYLNAFLLLEHKTNADLLTTFIELRKNALINVIDASHRSVRVQVLEMTRCLIRTIQLLHSCFIGYDNSNKGLVWTQLKNIVDADAPTTLSKMIVPPTPMLKFLPEIITKYRPKYTNATSEITSSEITTAITNWLQWTMDTVRNGLEKSLDLVTNVKALSILREEALKIELPANWKEMCQDADLSPSFDVWTNFFQPSITRRAEQLITNQIGDIMQEIQNNFKDKLRLAVKSEQFEGDLRWYAWFESQPDVSRDENKHIGLSMKTKGYSPIIVRHCEQIDLKFYELLQDLSVYLYGSENEKDWLRANIERKQNDKVSCVDRALLENHLRCECCKNVERLVDFLFAEVNAETDRNRKITEAILCARFLQAVNILCPRLSQCCSRGGKSVDWDRVANKFKEDSLKFWNYWLECCTKESEVLAQELLQHQSSIITMLDVLPKWESIDIQEQTDDKIFQTQIKIPSQPSLLLQQFLQKINGHLNFVIPHTLPKVVHIRFIEAHMKIILKWYGNVVDGGKLQELNQTQALQFLLDVKFVTLLSIPRDNVDLVNRSRDICDKLRSRVDPFDLDVFYEYLQSNVRRSVFNSQVILGCLLPSSGQLASLGIADKSPSSEKEPSLLAVSVPANNTWFPLLPVTAPIQKTVSLATATNAPRTETKASPVSKQSKVIKKTNNESTSSVRSGAAALFGAMTTDWFS